MADTRKYAEKLLDQLIVLDKQTTAAYYEMGRILYSIKQGKLYDVLGYESMSHLVKEELSFTTSTAHGYSKMYKDFARLSYHKVEALAMLDQFGLKHMNKVLPTIKTKIGMRAMKNRVAQLDEKQLTIWMHQDEYDEVAKALTSVGGIRDEAGRWKNSSEAILEMARIINKHNGKLKVA